MSMWRGLISLSTTATELYRFIYCGFIATTDGFGGWNIPWAYGV